MSTWDPWEHSSTEERNEWAIRDHLYAQRRLAGLDQTDTKAKVARMLAEVVPGPKTCGHVSGRDEGRRRCGAPAVRMIGLTGGWLCGLHDPLRPCPERDGPWRCSVGFAGHGWPHRLTTLEGGS